MVQMSAEESGYDSPVSRKVDLDRRLQANALIDYLADVWLTIRNPIHMSEQSAIGKLSTWAKSRHLVHMAT